MPFTDQFLKKDRALSLLYRAEMDKYFKLSMECLDKGEFTKSEMHFNHLQSLRRELIRMHRDKMAVDAAQDGLYRQLSDRELNARRNWF
ncbi:hypothetical protein SAMN04487943_101336 [Gracilibacillus orientalis]|uniref:Uncharacterized protein n=1 Tax=Gracilibacillus orientalis TaxID=334253 RepID=A0A1I4HDR3_9BACI|nr:hypothetical protein [Gracilibacillus orientalis]SFL39546.1 hypothetical protein SAMN04487943_101336 [Gracilibacillus orientalis]